MDFEIVLACDEAYGIGNLNTLPWKIAKDIEFFKQLTSQPDTVIIMGRKTADGFPKPLPRRINVVITSMEKYRPGFQCYKSLDDALIKLAETGHFNKVFVIGGNQLVETAIYHRRCRGVYLNKIHKTYPCDVKLSEPFVKRLHSTFNSIEKTDVAQCTKLNESVAITYTKFNYVNKPELKFIDIMENVYTTGQTKNTRNAITISKFFNFLEFDMADGFPLLTMKQMFYRGMLEELCSFLRGDTNAKHLDEKKVNIWNGNTSQAFLDSAARTDLKPFDMGPMYGFQWRFFNAKYTDCHADYEGKGFDQLQDLIDTLATDPASRRLLMTTYNPEQAKQGVLYPCHSLITQCGIEEGNRLSIIMYQRSADLFLGAPFNIASTSALLHIITELVNNHSQRVHKKDYLPGRVIIVLGDYHIYIDEEQGSHREAVEELFRRKDQTYPFCDLKIKKKLSSLLDLKDLNAGDFEISNYICGSTIKAKMVA